MPFCRLAFHSSLPAVVLSNTNSNALLSFTSQSLRDQLNIALENEKKAKDELEKLKEEIRAERASVQAARVIEKQKREVGINRQVEMFNQSQEAVNQRVDSLVTAMGGLSKVQVVIDGVTQGTNTVQISCL